MILLHEAIERFNESAHPYGIRVSPWRRRARAARLVHEVERAIGPLELPPELRTFWSTYDPSTVVRPALHGFIPLQEAKERRLLDCPPAPRALFPLADWTHSRVWVELATEDHPVDESSTATTMRAKLVCGRSAFRSSLTCSVLPLSATSSMTVREACTPETLRR